MNSTFKKAVFEGIALLLFVAVAGIVFFETNTHFVEEGAASGGAMENAALFPELLAGAIVILCALHFARMAWTGRIEKARSSTAPEGPARMQTKLEASEENPANERPLTRAFICLAAFIAYLLVVDLIGYHIATPVWLAIQFAALGVKNLLLVAATSILGSLLVASIFEGMLNIVLPVGIFEIVLPF